MMTQSNNSFEMQNNISKRKGVKQSDWILDVTNALKKMV